MPTLPKGTRSVPEDAFRVLVTGFGVRGPPFSHYEENPSWSAVKSLHNTIIYQDQDQLIIPENGNDPSRPIHISALRIPVSYEAVLNIVPGLHLRPPVLPESTDLHFPPPPDHGYDFIFHIGVAGRGDLRMERLGHKLGYFMKDADGKLAPVVRALPMDFSRRPDEPSVAENIERERLGMEIVETTTTTGDTGRSTRGHGAAYENFADDLSTEIDVTRLVQDLKQSGIEQIYTSMDAGHYICDFTYYCSLAEAKRTSNPNPYEKLRNTQVLFLHCPPVGQPLETQEVSEAIKRIVLWVCKELELAGDDDDTDGVNIT